MIEISSGKISWKDYKNLFEVIKRGGLIRVGNLAFVFSKNKNWLDVRVCAIGKNINEKVMFAGDTKPKKKIVPERKFESGEQSLMDVDLEDLE